MIVADKYRFTKLNPQIELPAHVKIPLKLTSWPHDGPRRAGVSDSNTYFPPLLPRGSKLKSSTR